ncbi:MAG: hypothetical protein AB1420_00165 [Bacillota bacterium]
MLMELISFCSFVLNHGEPIVLHIYRQDEDYFQRNIIYQYEDNSDLGFIIFKAQGSDEFLINLTGSAISLKTDPISETTYTIFPREQKWGKEILYEIIDIIHGKEVIYAVGTLNEDLARVYLKTLQK